MASYSEKPLKFTSYPDLSWLTGSWIGSQEGQYIEEHWGQPAADESIGMFRMVQEDRPVFYEFMTLGLEDQIMKLKIKHFNPGLIGWEEKNQAVIYEMVHLEEDEAVFYKQQTEDPNWMIYRRDKTKLAAFFADVNGPVDGSRFEFERNVLS